MTINRPLSSKASSLHHPLKKSARAWRTTNNKATQRDMLSGGVGTSITGRRSQSKSTTSSLFTVRVTFIPPDVLFLLHMYHELIRLSSALGLAPFCVTGHRTAHPKADLPAAGPRALEGRRWRSRELHCVLCPSAAHILGFL